MTTEVGKLEVPVEVSHLDTFKRGLRDASGAYDKYGRQMEGNLRRIESRAVRLGRTGALALGGLAVAAGAAAFKIVGMAGDAAETDSKLQVTFGRTLPGLTKQLDKFSAATGASRYALRQQAADIGALLKPMQLGEKQTAKMSLQVVKLATDLGSFNNVPVDDALLALRSGLTGETEPLKRFGILINEAAIEQEALRLGLVKGKDALSEQAKVAARYSLILKQTKDAQGDAAKTADSYSNLMKNIGNAARDAATDLGKSLLPAATEIAKGLADFVRGDTFNQWLADAKIKAQELGRSLSQYLASDDFKADVEAAAGFVKNLGEALGTTVQFVVQHGNAIKNLALMYLGLRAAMLGIAAATAIVSTVTTVATGLAAIGTAAGTAVFALSGIAPVLGTVGLAMAANPIVAGAAILGGIAVAAYGLSRAFSDNADEARDAGDATKGYESALRGLQNAQLASTDASFAVIDADAQVAAAQKRTAATKPGTQARKDALLEEARAISASEAAWTRYQQSLEDNGKAGKASRTEIKGLKDDIDAEREAVAKAEAELRKIAATRKQFKPDNTTAKNRLDAMQGGEEAKLAEAEANIKKHQDRIKSLEETGNRDRAKRIADANRLYARTGRVTPGMEQYIRGLKKGGDKAKGAAATAKDGVNAELNAAGKNARADTSSFTASLQSWWAGLRGWFSSNPIIAAIRARTSGGKPDGKWTGGRIGGEGTSTSDSNLIRVSKDEYVIRAAAAKRIGYGNLDRLNALGDIDDLPGFAKGGKVKGPTPAEKTETAFGTLQQRISTSQAALDVGLARAEQTPGFADDTKALLKLEGASSREIRQLQAFQKKYRKTMNGSTKGAVSSAIAAAIRSHGDYKRRRVEGNTTGVAPWDSLQAEWETTLSGLQYGLTTAGESETETDDVAATEKLRDAYKNQHDQYKAFLAANPKLDAATKRSVQDAMTAAYQNYLSARNELGPNGSLGSAGGDFTSAVADPLDGLRSSLGLQESNLDLAMAQAETTSDQTDDRAVKEQLRDFYQGKSQQLTDYLSANRGAMTTDAITSLQGDIAGALRSYVQYRDDITTEDANRAKAISDFNDSRSNRQSGGGGGGGGGGSVSVDTTGGNTSGVGYVPHPTLHPVFFDGQQINDLDYDSTGVGIKLKGIHGWDEAEDARVTSEERAGMDGELPRELLMGGATIVLKGIVVGSSRQDYFTRRRDLKRLLQPGRLEKILKLPDPTYEGAISTVFATTMAGYHRRECRVIASIKWGEQHGRYGSEFEVELRASDPRRYDDVDQTQQTTSVATGGGRTYPKTYPKTYGLATTGGTVEVSNTGDYDAPWVGRIWGPATNPIVEDVNGLGQLVFDGLNITTGEYIEFDVLNRTVTLNGDAAQSRYQYLDFAQTSWWFLPEGASTIRLRGSVVSDPARLDVIFRPAHL